MTEIYTIGYEGASLDDFIATLQAAEIEHLFDIRERAQSRRPGFSKTALSKALAAAGIGYTHIRELGDPKEGRDAARAGDWLTFERVFAGVLDGEPAKRALDMLSEWVSEKRACLLCYERDPKTCHRSHVARVLNERVESRTVHLGVQPLRVAAE